MLETPHVAVGAAIATKIPNPFISIPLAFASHVVLDKIPHWNPHTYTEAQENGIPKKRSIIIISIDILVALSLGLYMASLQMPNTAHAVTIVAASLASVLIDVVKYPFFMLPALRKGIYKKMVDFERSHQNDVEAVYGLTTQAITIAAALYWVFG